MTKLGFPVLAFLAALSSLAFGQQDLPRTVTGVHPNQEIRVSGLPSLRAQSKDSPDVLATALATVLNDKDLCCDKGSSLDDRLPQSDPVSLQEVAAKLQGRQLHTDGRPVLITAELFAADSVNSGQLISAIRDKHPPLMEWRSHLYVVGGVVYDDTFYSDGTETYVVRKFLLLDTRYSDSRREVSFDRDIDDLSKIQGILFLTVQSQ
jgi:hypothetical protein